MPVKHDKKLDEPAANGTGGSNQLDEKEPMENTTVHRAPKTTEPKGKL